MNTIAKLGVAGALSLSYVSAHAAFVSPTSTSPGDVLLFAEVLNSSGSVIGSYAADTTVAVSSSITSIAISAATDANLQSLLTLGAGAGNSIKWAVMGGGGIDPVGSTQYALPGKALFVTTLTTAGSLAANGVVGSNLNNWAKLGGVPFTNGTVPTINSNLANLAPAGTHTADTSIFATSAAAGGVWDTTVLQNGVQNWFSFGTSTAVSGLGSSSLYSVTGNGNVAPVLVSALGTATLSATGFTFSNSVAAVPLPAAVWLLGSGLLGLVGVGRRKAVAVAAA
jgi:hypothetical protein